MVRVDVSDVERAEKEAVKELNGVRSAMADAGRRAALYSRTKHYYRNRTFRAQRSTLSVTTTEGDKVFTLVQIGMFYGSFLENRGIAQLSDGVDIMRNELGYYFAAIGTGIK